MLKRIGAAAALLIILHTGAVAQTVRFTTNVGSFDMVLNPTNDANLQPLVDNIVAYIGLGSYHFTAINRAHENEPGTADDFVLQMGGFFAGLTMPQLWASTVQPIEALSPVILDANNDDLVDFNGGSNVRGTVSMALGGIPNSVLGDPNSGTSSFFVNVGNNSVLDDRNFVPFARIDNMTTIDRIMQAPQTNVTSIVGVDAENLAFKDVPLTADGQINYITDIDVVEADEDFNFCGPIISALELMKARSGVTSSGLRSASTQSLEAEVASLQADEPLDLPIESAQGSVAVIPEPATMALGLFSVFVTFMVGRRSKR